MWNGTSSCRCHSEQLNQMAKQTKNKQTHQLYTLNHWTSETYKWNWWFILVKNTVIGVVITGICIENTRLEAGVCLWYVKAINQHVFSSSCRSNKLHISSWLIFHRCFFPSSHKSPQTVTGWWFVMFNESNRFCICGKNLLWL